MQVPFRQGIVKSVPNFLQLTGSTVSLVVPQPAYVLVTVADGSSDYLISESSSVSSAWVGPFVAGTDYWLFWDIHPTTGVKTYGHTLYEPVESAVAPQSPFNDQHWYDSASHKMKVWNAVAGRWIEKIRVFAARLTNSSQLISMSINSPAFEGTQVGSYVSTPVLSGYLVLDNEGKALRKGNGKFFTTEDVGVTGITNSSRVKLSSIVREAEAAANMAARTVVAFTDFDTIEPADPIMVAQGNLFGIIEEDVVIGDYVNVVFEGMVSSPSWDWTAAGINASLYINAGGVLSTTATAPALNPIAVVSGIHSIQFGVPKVVNTIVGGNTVDVMTAVAQGTGKLSLAAANPADPVVVGDNDPRMTDNRLPLAHSHTIGDVSNLQTTLDGKVAKAGDTMSGALTLSGDPTLALHAATKQYVDVTAGAANQISQLSSVLAITDTGIGDGQLMLTLGGVQTAVVSPHGVNVQGAAIPNEWAQYVYNYAYRVYTPVSVVDSQGNIVLVDETAYEGINIYKIDTTGAIVWSISRPSYGTFGGNGGVAIDSQDRVYASFEYDGVVGSHIVAISPLGAVLWSASLSSGGGNLVRIYSVAVDSTDNCIVSGWLTNGPVRQCYIAKLNSSGTVLWSKTLPNQAGVDNYYYTISTSGADIYAVSTDGLGIASDISAMKLDGSGNVVWQQLYSSPVVSAGSSVRDSTVVNGYMYFGVAISNVDGTFINVIHKIDAATGAIVWTNRVDAAKGRITACAVDPVTNVSYWMLGAIENLTGDELAAEVTIVSFDSAGNAGVGNTLGQRTFIMGDQWYGGHRALTYRGGWLWATLLVGGPSTFGSEQIVNAHLSTTSFMLGNVAIDPPFSIYNVDFSSVPVTPTTAASTLVWSPVTIGQTTATLTTSPSLGATSTTPTYVVTEVSVDWMIVRDTVYLGRDPIDVMEAATKRYVDNIVFPLPPLTGFTYGSVGDNIGDVYGTSLQQSTMTTRISTSGIAAKPVVSLTTPPQGTPTPNNFGYGIILSPVDNPAFDEYAAFAVFQGGTKAEVFVNPWSQVIDMNPAGSGIPVGEHGIGDYQRLQLRLPSATPAAFVASAIGVPSPITPSSPTGLFPATVYDFTLTFYDETYSLVETQTYQVNGSNAPTFASLITALNKAFVFGPYSEFNRAPKCAWSFDNTLVFVTMYNGNAHRQITVDFGSPLMVAISNYYYGMSWQGQAIYASGPTVTDALATNTDLAAAGLSWVFPVEPSVALNMYQPG